MSDDTNPMQSEQLDKLFEALSAAQGKFPEINKGNEAKIKTRDNSEYSYRYADLADVLKAVRPALAAHGLALIQRPLVTPQGMVIETRLCHSSGQWIAGEYLLQGLSGAKQQEIGSAITYARRYTACPMLGISPDEDDDGAKADEKAEERSEHAYKTIAGLPDCPVCKTNASVIKNQYEGGGFYCWPKSRKRKGCGQKFQSDHASDPIPDVKAAVAQAQAQDDAPYQATDGEVKDIFDGHHEPEKAKATAESKAVIAAAKQHGLSRQSAQLVLSRFGYKASTDVPAAKLSEVLLALEQEAADIALSEREKD